MTRLVLHRFFYILVMGIQLTNKNRLFAYDLLKIINKIKNNKALDGKPHKNLILDLNPGARRAQCFVCVCFSVRLMPKSIIMTAAHFDI